MASAFVGVGDDGAVEAAKEAASTMMEMELVEGIVVLLLLSACRSNGTKMMVMMMIVIGIVLG